MKDTLYVLTIFLLPFGLLSCNVVIIAGIEPLEKEVRLIKNSVEAQKWICDSIEEPVYYRGRKVYNGNKTRYHRYQSCESGKYYKPKHKLNCQELGKRPFTEEKLKKISSLEGKIDSISYRWISIPWLIIFICWVFSSIGYFIILRKERKCL